MANLLFRLVHLPSAVAHGVSYHLGWLKILADQVSRWVAANLLRRPGLSYLAKKIGQDRVVLTRSRHAPVSQELAAVGQANS
jgi:hypothetical protein